MGRDVYPWAQLIPEEKATDCSGDVRARLSLEEFLRGSMLFHTEELEEVVTRLREFRILDIFYSLLEFT